MKVVFGLVMAIVVAIGVVENMIGDMTIWGFFSYMFFSTIFFQTLLFGINKATFYIVMMSILVFIPFMMAFC